MRSLKRDIDSFSLHLVADQTRVAMSSGRNSMPILPHHRHSGRFGLQGQVTDAAPPEMEVLPTLLRRKFGIIRPLWITVRHDPRMTAVGAFLRRFKLDELPQLWNT
jgi:Bacterial sugar transferase